MVNHANVLSTLIVSVSLASALSGCMHALMMGGHSEDMKSDTVIEMRIVENSTVVSAVIPPMKAGEDIIVRITVQQADDKKPVKGADIAYHWMRQTGSVHQHSTPAPSDTMMLSGTATEGNDGEYTFTLSPVTGGRYTLTITVLADARSKPISFDVERVISMEQSTPMGMVGMDSSSLWIAGGAIMAAMMLVVWAVRAGI